MISQPVDWGDLEARESFVNSLTLREKLRLEQQDAVLAAYAAGDSVTLGCAKAGVTPWVHNWWERNDHLGYRARYQQAHRERQDYFEQLAVDRVRNPEGNRGGDTLVIALNNANNPDKWRGGNVTVEVGSEFTAMMQKLQQEAEEIRQASGRQVIEGTGKLVTEPLDLDKYSHPGDDLPPPSRA